MTIELARRPEDVPAVFAARFNTGDLAQVREVYEEGAVLVAEPGAAVAGDALGQALRGHLSLGAPIEVLPRHVFTSGDIALLIVDWRIAGNGPDGSEVSITGTATDVARRGADGRWRYVIDNPSGTG